MLFVNNICSQFQIISSNENYFFLSSFELIFLLVDTIVTFLSIFDYLIAYTAEIMIEKAIAKHFMKVLNTKIFFVFVHAQKQVLNNVSQNAFIFFFNNYWGVVEKRIFVKKK